MTTTKEKPILFSGEMVRAILGGRKTQERRIVKLDRVLSPAQRKIGFEQCPDWSLFRASRLVEGVPRLCVPVRHPDDRRTPWEDCGAECLYAPYEVGMRLWVRETFAIESNHDFMDIYSTPDNPLGPVRWIDYEEGGQYFQCPRYRASEPDTLLVLDGDDHDPVMRWRPSIHMPRWASRITLEITDVRVQRLQEISEEDALAEGVEPTRPLYGDCGGYIHEGGREAFKNLWDSINTKPGTRWEDSPWVWAYTFRRVEE